jgi:CRISPR/Cas system-associated exonuclease Cas4 (RecB family)
MADYARRYNPNRSTDWNYGGSKWRLSRSKIDAFLECPRCFYLDNVLGTKRPSGPAFTLNVAVDTLLKREFDVYRKKKTPHPLMRAYGIDAVPFEHRDLDVWRDAFSGIEHLHASTGLCVSGAVDDIWVTSNNELIVVDYKATAKTTDIRTIDDVSWGKQYARQISVYQWLLTQNGFTVSLTGYLVYANGNAEADGFNDTLSFRTTLVPITGDTDWIENALARIKETLTSDSFPESGPDCEYCPYREACGKKLQALHAKNHVKA